MYLLVMVCVHARDALSDCIFHHFEAEEVHATNSAVPQPFQQYGGAYSSGGLTDS